MKLDYDPKTLLLNPSESREPAQRTTEGGRRPVIDSRTGDTSSLMYIAFHSDTMHPSQITDYLLRVVRRACKRYPGREGDYVWA